MENKTDISSLAVLLALHTGCQKELSNEFLKGFFSLIKDSLLRGEDVRIKNFGTFRIVDVEPRKSVNVSTGEDFIIAAHKKIVFIPSPSISSIVNSAFEAFHTIEISEHANNLLKSIDAEDNTLEPEETEDLETIEILNGSEESAALLETIAENETIPEEEVIGNENDLSDNRIDSQSIGEGLDDDASADAYLTILKETEEKEEKIEEEIDSIIQQEEDYRETDNLSEEKGSLILDSKTTDSKEESGESSDSGAMDSYILEDESGEMPDIKALEIETENSEKPVHVQSNSGFKNGFFYGICATLLVGVIVFSILYYFADFGFFRSEIVELPTISEVPTVPATTSVQKPTESPVEPDPEIKSDIAEENQANTMESDAPVYDRVSPTRYLTIIAQEHYGNFNFWPYIYEENKAILGHPNRIKPGTKVVVPPLSKYGVDPKNQKDIERAKKKGAEIYAQFN